MGLPSIEHVLNTLRGKALNRHSLLSKLLSNIGVGRLAFWLRLLHVKFEMLLLSRFSQRSLEYPWVLQQLRTGQERMLLDVGCTRNLLDHELLARGFHVVGLDVEDHTLRNYREKFIQTNILNNGLPSETFDVILMVSTIEHVGLDTYSQKLVIQDGDIKTMKELKRLLKKNGILLLTTPYEGKGSTQIYSWAKGFLERRYDSKRLAKLLRGFTVVESTFFLCRLKPRCTFVPVKKTVLDKLPSEACEGSLACLMLQKKG